LDEKKDVVLKAIVFFGRTGDHRVRKNCYKRKNICSQARRLSGENKNVVLEEIVFIAAKKIIR